MNWGWTNLMNQAQRLVVDFFADDNATALASHTPDYDSAGNGWSEDAGSWAITGNQAYVDTKVDQDEFATIDCEDANVTMVCDLTITDDGAVEHNAGFVWRYSGAADWWILYLDINDQSLVLAKSTTGGGFSVEQIDASYAWTSGTKRIAVIMNGDVMTIQIDGVTKFTETDSDNNTNTKHGLFNRNTITQRWDNFQIINP